METVETIERKMRLQRIVMRFILILLLLALCFLIGWLISQSSYDGIEHEVLDMYFMRHPIIGHA